MNVYLESRPRIRILDVTFIVMYAWIISYGYSYLFLTTGVSQSYSYILIYIYALFVMFAWQSLNENIGKIYVGDISHIKYLIYWSALYVVCIGVQSMRLASHEEVMHSLFRNLGMLTLIWCGAYLIVVFSSTQRIALITAMVVFFAVCVNIFDFFSPTFSYVPGRSAGLYSNPNISGQLISMLMIVGVTAVKKKLQIAFILFCGLGVLLTFSRGAWVLWVIGLVFWLGRKRKIEGLKSMLYFGILVIIGASIGFLLFSGAMGELISRTPIADYLTSNTVARLGIGSPVLSGASAEARGELVDQSFREWSDAVLFGKGFGYTSLWSVDHRPHNMYLIFLVECGIVGACVYLGLLVLLWQISDGVTRIVTLQYAVSGMFTHNNLEQPAIALILSYIIANSILLRRAKYFVR